MAFASMPARAAEPAAREPHIALLLPLASPSFGRHADAVRQGFLAAASAGGGGAPPIRVYSASEDAASLLASYEQAIESGAQLVVGPLTRDGVAALAASSLVSVPTLALNALDPSTPQPARLYLFGLAAEEEARQVAQLAFTDGRRNALVVSDGTPVGRRMRQAFVTEFARSGGMTTDVAYSADQQDLARLAQLAATGTADMVFLALDSARARLVRPYLGNALGLYATSQVNAGGGALAAHDLNLVYFIDMPWLLEPDHPAVMVYPRPQLGDGIEFERLYALGIDAYRIGIELLRNSPDPSLDGVTGQIRLTRALQFVRELPAAQFIDGRTALRGQPR